jgi:hypothetical protein
MAKSTDLKVVNTTPPAPPRKPANGWKRFRILCSLADSFVDYLDSLEDVRKELDKRMPNTAA